MEASKDTRKLDRMVLKMRNMLSSSISVHVMTLKYRISRGVMGLRPPPGGPIAANRIVSINLRNVRSLRSYLATRGKRQVEQPHTYSHKRKHRASATPQHSAVKGKGMDTPHAAIAAMRGDLHPHSASLAHYAPAAVVAPLPQQLDGGLCKVLLSGGHVEVVHEQDVLGARRGAVHASATLLHLGVDDVLVGAKGATGGGSGKKGNSQNC
jgi:hypothetical protein